MATPVRAAVAAEQRFFQDGGDNDHGRHNMHDLSERDTHQQQSITGLFQAAVRAQQQGLFQQAKEGYLQVLARSPSHFASLHHLGMLALQQQCMGEALQWLQAAL